jgi:hypothetical protein
MHAPIRFSRNAAALAAGLAAAVAGWPANAFDTSIVVAVSKPTSPFAGCTADNVAAQAGTNYPNTEIEPYLDSAPRNPLLLIAGWQQDRWSNGGARGLAAAVSSNGGRSWRTVIPPGVSKCAGGPYDRASDPWVTISPNGNAYFMSLAFDNDLPDGRFGPNAMLVNRSRTGGKSWSAPITLRFDGPGQALNDKNSMTADPTNARFVYAVWDRLVDYSLPVGLDAGGARGARLRADYFQGLAGAKVAAGKSAKAAAAPVVYYEGPTYFTRTTNAGESWEPARIVYDPGPNAQTINNLVEVTPTGTVVLFFDHINDQGQPAIELIRSSDKGATFEATPVKVDDILSSATYTITPDDQAPVRDAGILFDTAVDPRTGALYVAWQDGRFNGVEAIAFSQSTDGGSTWSKPVRIDRTPANAAYPLRQQAFIPSVDVGPRGEVIVTYYDFRNDGATGEMTDAWAIRCKAACSKRSSWDSERRLTTASFDLSKAPVARGLFLGDYMGLEVAGRTAYPLFGVTRDAADSADLVTRPITLN